MTTRVVDQVVLPAKKNFWPAALAAVLGIVGFAYEFGYGVILLIGFVVAAYRYLRTWHSVAIGCDGILLESRASERFIPWRQIERARHDPVGKKVVVKLVDGDAVTIQTGDRRRDVGKRLMRMVALRRRARARLAKREDEQLSPLPRQSASRRQWLTTTLHGDYRTRAVSEDELMAVTQSPIAPVADRVAAAMALEPYDDGASLHALGALAPVVANDAVGAHLEVLAKFELSADEKLEALDVIEAAEDG